MYAITEINSRFLNMLPFKVQSFETENEPLVNSLSSDLVHDSPSGDYINSSHPLLTFNNIISLAPNFRFLYKDYDTTINYTNISKVKFDGHYYKSLANNNLNNSLSNPLFWQEFSPLDEWLKKIIYETHIRVLESTIPNNEIIEEVTAFITQNTENNKVYIYNKEDGSPDYKWVGIRIRPTGKHKAILIHKIGLQFDAFKQIDMYLYKGNELLRKIAVQSNAHGNIEWTDFPTPILLNSENEYYLFYKQADLDTTATPPDYTWVNAIGTTINMNTNQIKNAFVSSFSVPADSDFNKLLPFTNNISYFSNYGINLLLSAQANYTDKIILYRNLFAQALKYQFAIDMLSLMLNNQSARDSEVARNILNAENKADIIFHTKPLPENVKSDFNNVNAPLSLKLSNEIDTLVANLKNIGIYNRVQDKKVYAKQYYI